MRLKVTILFVLCFLTVNVFSQIKPAQLKANWIFIIAENVTYPNQDKIDTIKIAVYGKDSEVFPFMTELAEEKQVKGKPVYVESLQRINQLEGFNVVYVDETKNDFLEAIYTKIHGTGTLLITYQSTDQEHFMINLLLKGVNEQFQIQSSNLYDEKIVAEDKLLSLGGTKVDLQGLFEKKVTELNEKEIQLKDKENELIRKEQELNELKLENDAQKRLNEKNSQIIDEKTKELEIQKQNAQKLLEQVAIQEQVLKKNNSILTNLNVEIASKQKMIQEQNDEIEKKRKEIEDQQKDIAEQQKRIDEQKATLQTKNVQIKTQRYIIWIIAGFVIVFLLLTILIFRSYRINKRINRELNEKNVKIEKQKDELTKQAIQLEEFNKELSKLSLVASKTDNSVIIMDKNTNIEWVNSGFTRIYGYTLQLLKNEKGDSLFEVTANKEGIKNIVDNCLSTKKTEVYVSKNETRIGETIWVQTALTPVVDDNGEVSKLIAVESDISKIKQQEMEIRQMNEELHMQKAELQAQKEMLEEVNQQIRDSINYALTIQKAILPLDADFGKFFANFVIFMPRDIVSGDFYWWSNPKENVHIIAVVDCTGHGVPGAFMSLIASRILEETVNNQHIYEPKEILNRLNKLTVNALSQESTNNRDGMDLCLIKVLRDFDKSEITFAGAKRPLYYYQRDKNEIQSIKGNRRSIGGVAGLNPKIDFEQETITLHKNDIVYLSTDGMVDQNNPERKRYGSAQFVTLLNNIKSLPLSEQKQVMLDSFNKYKKNEHQRDDITVWGIKV